MSRGGQNFVYWASIIVVVAALHMLLRQQTFSLISFPLTVATIIAFTVYRPWRVLVPLIIMVELLSRLPVGLMAVAMIIPLVCSRIARRPAADISFLFFGYIVLTVFAQIAWLTVATNIINGIMGHLSWAIIPQPALLMTLLSATAATFAIIIWREWVEPFAEHKTVPRYKRLSS